MRAFWTVVHRWMGLTVALFLIVAGLTGAVISWDHEIDEWLNADIMHTAGRGPLQDSLALAAAVQADDPRAEVSYMTLGLEEGHAASFLVRPRTDPATGAAFVLGYDTVYVDPVTARVTGRRDSHSIALSSRNLMPWLRHLHESLHMPAFWGSDRWGFWLMGGVALMWLIDSFVAFYLTFPPRQALRSARTWASRWRPSWAVRWRAGGYKLNFDLHRAGGLWVWGIIIVVSFTSFSLNLYREVFYPVMSHISTTTPGPYETLQPAPLGTFIEPRIGFAEAIAIARREGERLGFAHPPGGIWYGGDFPFYNVSFFDPSDEMGAMGMGAVEHLRQLRERRGARHAPSLARHRRRRVRAAAAAAALRAHPGAGGAHPHVVHGAHGGPALGHGHRHLGTQAPRAHAAKAWPQALDANRTVIGY